MKRYMLSSYHYKLYNKLDSKGFTLIEIIAVLVVLGIVAAVAIPKFINLQNLANEKVIQSAVAEGLSTCSMQFARLILSHGIAPDQDSLLDAVNNKKPASADFSYEFGKVDGDKISVKAKWTEPGKTGSGTRNFKMP